MVDYFSVIIAIIIAFQTYLVTDYRHLLQHYIAIYLSYIDCITNLL